MNNIILLLILTTYVSVAKGLRYGESGFCETIDVDCNFRSYYPNFDGSCNNFKHHTWGAGGTAFPRLLPPIYNDDAGNPRMYGTFRQLPSTRKISNIFNSEVKQFAAKNVSHLHPLFGQVIAHDIAHAPVIKNKDGTNLDCMCANQDANCFNIEIPRNDEQYLTINKTCISLVRSKAAVGMNNCEFAEREQFNVMSSYLDGSFLYGKSDQEANELRDPILPGELRMVTNPVDEKHKNLPNQFDFKNTDVANTIACPLKKQIPSTKCLVAGDVRANENPGLISLHIIMARYHNYVANNLKRINPSWNSNKIYNTARFIIYALVQSITYREYLPLLIGPTWMKRFDLQLSDKGYWNGYDSSYCAGITNEFTTAAFRYGHSQVKELLSRPDTFFHSATSRKIKSAETFWDIESLFEKNGGGSGSVIRGLMIDIAEGTDVTFTDALRNQLNTKPGEQYGDDLFAINIQRGRDHGFQGYNAYRKLCGLPLARTFDDLFREIPMNIIHKLASVYDSVNDIDLYVGGLAESDVEGGEVGPTFACILAYGFRALRKGDRFWHEHENSPTRFTHKQLETIRKTTFARILCDTSEDTAIIFKSPMEKWHRNYGQFVSCNTLPKLEVSAWKEGSRKEYNFKSSEFTWSPWFVTDMSQVRVYLIWHIKRRLLHERAGEVCKIHLKHETRKIRKDNYFQIRFLCRGGTIHVTDFPFQLSQHHYWTPWIQTDQYDAIQNLNKSIFDCKNIVDLQAMTKDGRAYAKETGDIFKNFSPKTGFTCRDSDQIRGWCEKYKVRALCKLSKDI